ncbi:MAG: sugar ABC transporter substrate-binding protein [Caldilinea sp. CFX5]|nr:sugar ABC transporter substrate-binding protein [Caldilinea sp. CFX5]
MFRLRWPLTAAVVLLVTLALAACVAPTASEAPAPAGDAAGEKVVLQYWEMDWGDQVTAALEQLVAEFNASHPNIQVEMTKLSWGDYVQKMLSAVAAGTPPDVTGGDSGLPFNFYAQGEALLLDDLYEGWKNDGTFDGLTQWGQDKWFFDGHYVGVTWQIDARAIYYRTDLFEAAGLALPTTHDELLAAAEALTDVAAEKYGLCIPGKAGSYDTDQFYMTLVLQNGGGLADVEGNPTFETPEHLAALNFEQELLAKAAPEGTPGYTFAEISRLYMQGQCAMVFNGGWFIQQLKQQAPDIYAVTDILDPLTGQGPNAVQRIVGFYNPWMVFKQSKHPEEALEFLKFMASPDSLKRVYQNDLGSKFSPFTALREDPMWDAEPMAAKLNQQVNDFSVDYWFPNNAAAIGIGSMGTGIADFIVNPVLVGARTPEEALADGQEKLGQLFKKMGQ